MNADKEQIPDRNLRSSAAKNAFRWPRQLVREPLWGQQCAKLSYMQMPETLRPTWNAVYHEVVAVHARWIIYRQLFAVSEARTNTLNASAGTFFCVIQATLLDDVQLTLSKLADPAMTRSQPNATLERLVDEIEKLNDQPFHDKLNDLLAEYRASCERIKSRRNKKIAHYDHATLLQQYEGGPAELPGPSRQEIEDSLAALRRFMEPAETLISVLEQGLRYKTLQIEGVIPWDDLRNSRCTGS